MEGPLISVASARRVLSVSEFASGLRASIEREFANAWIEGEISNLRTPASGHCYFTLKDESAQLRCVMWRSTMRGIPFRPRDGLHVRVRGDATLYEARGDVQIVVRLLQAAGEGALRQAFEDLKRKLSDEGLFDPAIKKPLPPLPRHIGIVTSGDGAALQDILSILRRRYPIARVSVHAVRVQGYGAAEEIAYAIEACSAMQDHSRPDVLIVGRGGGSIEDLWAFNEEVVARAIHRCAVPVISAVGHETDFSIADFVADFRAATPSMAAELVAPDRADLIRHIYALHDRMSAHHRVRIERSRRQVMYLLNSYVFNRPLDRLRQQQRLVRDLGERMIRCLDGQITGRRAALQALKSQIHLLDPRRPLERGYVLVEKNKRRVRSASDLRTSDDVTLHFADGQRAARIQD